jgi:hypothetical protein
MSGRKNVINRINTLVDLIKHEYPDLYHYLEGNCMTFTLQYHKKCGYSENQEYLIFLKKTLNKYLEEKINEK